MRNSIYILLLITLLSCQEKGLKTELENIYTISAKNEKDTLQIESFEIINKKTVNYDYAQKIKINSINYLIELNNLILEKDKENIRLYEKNIINRNKLIQLNESKKEEYLSEIEYDQQKLEQTKNHVKKLENEITVFHQKIVLMKAEFGQNKDQFELIKYLFKGKINNEARVDTMSIIKIGENNYNFISKNMFSDYKGI